LKNVLSIERAPYSIAAMLRILLELSTEYYLTNSPDLIGKDKPIKQKITCVLRNLHNKSLMNNTEMKALEAHVDSYVSMAHNFIHSPNSKPTKDTLEAFWANFKQYIILCLQS
jgi:hypothetical protein